MSNQDKLRPKELSHWAEIATIVGTVFAVFVFLYEIFSVGDRSTDSHAGSVDSASDNEKINDKAVYIESLNELSFVGATNLAEAIRQDVASFGFHVSSSEELSRYKIRLNVSVSNEYINQYNINRYVSSCYLNFSVIDRLDYRRLFFKSFRAEESNINESIAKKKCIQKVVAKTMSALPIGERYYFG